MTRIAILFSAFIFLVSASPSHALTFNFSFDGVQGVITGLDDNSANQSADSVEITVSPIGGLGEYVPAAIFNDFTVSAGVITFADFLSVIGDNSLTLNIGSAVFATNEGFAFGDFPSSSQVPVPGALPLFASGLGAFGFLAYRRQRRKAA